MLCSARKICSSKETTSTFDTYNSEAREVTALQGYGGVRTEVSKTLSPFLQISRICMLDKNAYVSQMFGTLSLHNSLFQVGVDHENGLQLKATCLNGNILGKIHTIISSKKEVFSQLELEIRNRVNNLGLKLITPAVKGANMIYVMSLLQQFGSLGLGAEVIGADCNFGVSLCGRHEHRNGVFSIGLQQFTALNLNYYHKLNRFLDFGAELQVSKSYPPNAAIGCRLSTVRTEVRTSINSDMSLGLSLDEKITEGLMLNINTEVGKRGCSYGFGFSLEF